MVQTLDSILLVGATGGLGKVVVAELVAKKQQFKRIAVLLDVSRSVSAEKKEFLDSIQQSGIELMSTPGYSNPTIYKGFDCVMIFLGNHALRLQPEIIEAALEGGVRHFYPSEYGADLLAGTNWTQRYYRDKVITRQVLEAKGREHEDLGWTYFINGRLTEWAVLQHFGVNNNDQSARIYGTGKGRQSLLAEGDCARYLVATLRDPIQENQGTDHRRTYRISGRTISWEEVFKTLEQVRGVPYAVTYLETESALKEAADAVAEGNVDKELAASHKLIAGREGSVVPEPWDNDKFPDIKPIDILEALKTAFANPGWQKRYGLE